MGDVFTEFRRLLEVAPAGGGGIEMVLAQLDAITARAVRLSAIPHRFDGHIVALLLPELDMEAVAAVGATLASLAVVTPVPDGFALHDEPRRYLFRQWLEPDRAAPLREASARLAAHFAREVEGALPAARAALERQQAFHLFPVERARSHDLFDRLFEDALEAANSGEGQATIDLLREYEPILSPEDRARLAYDEGAVAAMQRSWPAAREAFARVLGAGEAGGLVRLRALHRLGLVELAARDPALATRHLRAAVSLAERSPEARNLVYRCVHDLGVALRDTGRDDEAELLFGRALELAEQARDHCYTAIIHNSLGMLHRRMGQFQRAVAEYKMSIAILEAAGEHGRAAQVYNNLGLLHLDLGNFAASKECFQHSLDVKREAGDVHGQAMTFANLAHVYQRQGSTEIALEKYGEAIRSFHEAHDGHGAAVALRRLALLHRARKEFDAANDAFAQAAKLFAATAPDEARATEEERCAVRDVSVWPWWTWTLVLLTLLAGAIAVGYGAGGGASDMNVRNAALPAPTVVISAPIAAADGGIERASIRHYVGRQRDKIKHCYEKRLLGNPRLAGTVRVRFLIDGDGRVGSVTADGIGDTELEGCVADVIKAIEFPALSDGSAVHVIYPFAFYPAPESSR